MSQTLLTSFFTVRKPGSQEFKQKDGNVTEVKKRKREDEEEHVDQICRLCQLMQSRASGRPLCHSPPPVPTPPPPPAPSAPPPSASACESNTSLVSAHAEWSGVSGRQGEEDILSSG